MKYVHQRAFKRGKSMTNVNAYRTVGDNIDIYVIFSSNDFEGCLL